MVDGSDKCRVGGSSVILSNECIFLYYSADSLNRSPVSFPSALHSAGSLYCDKEFLKEIGIPITEHSKLPDIVIYDSNKEWLFLIEVVTSHGPVSPKRVVELEDFMKECKAGKVYITAFPDRTEFKKTCGGHCMGN